MPSPVVGVDLGGTKVFGARVDPGQPRIDAVLDHAKVPTPDAGADAIIEAIVEVVHRLDARPGAVGVGTPGGVEPGTGRVLFAPNLSGFDRPVPLGAELSRRLGCPVTVANDVNLAAYGEVRAGVAVGHSDVLAVWMGTGLGAGLVLDGRLRVGPSGLAGELGHVVAVPGGRPCACGGTGHVEAYIGRRALEQEARALHAAGRATMLVELAGDGPMKSKVFRTAYDAGDPVARELVDQGMEILSVAVGNAAALVDVGAVVVGGGLGERFAALAVDRIGATLTEMAVASPVPAVLEAELGDFAGALGAALWASDTA